MGVCKINRDYFKRTYLSGVTDPNELSKITKYTKKTVYKLIKVTKVTGDLITKPKSGRPKKLDKNQMARLKYFATNHPLSSNSLLSMKMAMSNNPRVSRMTLARALTQLKIREAKARVLDDQATSSRPSEMVSKL